MMNRKAADAYNQLLKAAAVASCGELCEMYLNKASGMLDYALLCEDMTGAEYEHEMRRHTAARAAREARRYAA